MSVIVRTALLLIAVIAATAAAPVAAQPVIGVIDSVFFHTRAPYSLERPMYRGFGYHRDYTDSIDQFLPTNWETEIPAFPPQSFYVLFDALTVPAWIDKDIRGIPDSVLSGQAQRFSLSHEFEIQRYDHPTVVVVFPREFPGQIDSINFRDIIPPNGGVIFSTTLTHGPDSVVIPSSTLTRVRMTVYYNLTITGIGPAANLVSGSELRLSPNPAGKGGNVRVASELPPGTRLIVSTPLGLAIEAGTIDVSGGASLEFSDYPSGVYFLRAVGRRGEVLAHERLVIQR